MRQDQREAMQKIAMARNNESRLDQVRADLQREADHLEEEDGLTDRHNNAESTGRALKKINISSEDNHPSFKTHEANERKRLAKESEEKMKELLAVKLPPKDIKDTNFLNETQNIQAMFGTAFKPQTAITQANKLRDLQYDPPTVSLEELARNKVNQVYLLDIVEEQTAPHYIHLICRVLHHNAFCTVKIRVKDSKREFYIIPKKDNSAEETLEEIRNQIGGKKIRGEFKNELHLDIVSRKYCFEYAVDLRGDERPVVRGTYTFRLPALSTLPAEGETYNGVFGLNYTCLELFQLRHRVMGPGWYELKDLKCEREELEISDVTGAIASCDKPDVPPVTLAGIQVLQSDNGKEIMEIMLTIWAGYEIEKGKWNTVDHVRYTRAAAPESAPVDKAGEKSTCYTFDNEYSMLNDFMILLSKIDPDVIIGHDFYSGCLDALYLRLESKFSEPNSLMARVVTKKIRSHNISAQVRMLFAGRLLVDVFSFARETEKMEDYSLPSLYVQFVDKNARSLDITNLREMNNCLIRVAKTLQVMPLTLQLSKVAGCLWSVSLRQARSERNEMLLMHNFWQKGYIVPEKLKRIKDFDGEPNEEKKSYSGGKVLDPVSGLYTTYVVLVDFNSLYPSIIRNFKICFTTVRREFKNFKEQFLEEEASANPNRMNIEEDQLKLGEADETDEIVDPLAEIDVDPSSKPILPDILTYLVRKRKEVKALIKVCKNEQEAATLDVRQKAYKLIANSLYGCLGFQSSRFYTRKMALLITTFGRRLLMNSKKFIEEKGFNVVYGDTDSIMINTMKSDTLEAIRSGYIIKKEINSQFKKKSGEEQILEVELDGVFKKILLLKKKKYAGIALKNFVEIGQGRTQEEVLHMEVKGLDLVRRDWSGVTRLVSEKVLSIMLDTGDLSEVSNYLFSVREALDLISVKLIKRYGGKISPEEAEAEEKKPPSNSSFPEITLGLKDFIIKKQLNKKPSEYKEGAGLPHVKVAKFLQAQGQSEEQLVNHFIPYVIVKGDGGLADKAMHPDEFSDLCSSDNPPKLDIDWYKVNQIIGPIERLVEVVDPLAKDALPTIFGLKDNAAKQESQVEESASDKIHSTAMKSLNNFYSEGRDVQIDVLRVPCSKCQKYCLGYLTECTTVSPPQAYSDQELSNRFSLMLANLVRHQLKTTYSHSKCSVSSTQVFMEKCPKCGKDLTIDPNSAAKKKYANLAYLKELVKASFKDSAPYIAKIDHILSKSYEMNIMDSFKIYASHFPFSKIQLYLKTD